MWFKGSKFSFLKDINVQLHAIVSEFQEIDELYRKKLAAFSEFRENSNRKSQASLYSEIHSINRLLQPDLLLDKRETRAISKLVSDIEELIRMDFSRNRMEKTLSYQEYKNLIALKHLIEGYSQVILKQKQFIDRNKSLQKVQSGMAEFTALLQEEGRIIGLEEKELPALEKETEELLEEEEKDFDITLIGYGSLMRTREVSKEVERTLGRDLTSAEFKARVAPVLVYGWQRIFDKAATRGVWETPADVAAKRIAVLNIRASPFHYFNGIAIKLTTEEFKAFSERERNYGVIELRDVRHFVTGEPLKERSVCFKSEFFRPYNISDDDPILKELHPWPRKLIRSDATPPIKYYATVVVGAEGLDRLLSAPGMFLAFLKTTYLYYFDSKGHPLGEISVLQLREIRDLQRWQRSRSR